MRRVFGFALFWFAIGMLVMLILSNEFWGMILIATTLLFGYHLYQT